MEKDKDTDKIVSSLKNFFESKEFSSVLNNLPHSVLSTLFETSANITIENCFEAYDKAVEEVRRDKRKTPEARKEKLKKLLTPITMLNKAIALDKAYTLGATVKENSARLTLPDGTSLFPFIPLTIDLNNDLDISKLTYDKDSYYVPYVQCRENGSCVTCGEALLNKRWSDEDIIWHKRSSVMKDGFEEVPPHGRLVKVKSEEILLEKGSHDLWDLYEWWLPSMDSERLKSNDLLDQMLVVYTIKRALNGDSKAVDALYNAYKRAAIGIACKMALKRGLRQYLEDIKQNAKMFLRLAIPGSTPETIFDSLLKTEKSKYLPIPKWIVSFYIWYYSEYVPEAMEDYMKRLEKGEKMHPVLEAFFIPTILNPHTPIKDKNRWMVPEGKRLYRFNSYSFRPNKNTNLTVWLFGTLNNPMQGRFCQLVSKQLDEYHKALKIEALETDLLSRSEDSGEEEHRMHAIEYPIAQEKQKNTMGQLELDNIIEKLIEKGVSERNTEIFSKNTFGGYNKTELAKEYDLSRMTIHRICKHVKEMFKENEFY